MFTIEGVYIGHIEKSDLVKGKIDILAYVPTMYYCFVNIYESVFFFFFLIILIYESKSIYVHMSKVVSSAYISLPCFSSLN